MIIFLALVALCLSGSASANGQSNKSCKAVPPRSNFDIDRYMGTWYDNFMHVETQPAGNYMLCNYGIYTRNETGAIDVVSHYQEPNSTTPETFEASIHFPNENDTFKQHLRFRASPGEIVEFYILATDYETYSIFYNCKVWYGTAYENIWISTREQHPSAEIFDKAATELEKYGISRSILRKIDQIDC